jgi:hypothetical protein
MKADANSAASRPLGTTSSLPERAGLERARSISACVKDYGVVLDL